MPVNELHLSKAPVSKEFSRSSLILIALAVCAFAIGTAEFVMAGVLPNIAASFSVTIPVAGWLMTAYAISVALSAPLLAALTIRLPRKMALMSLMSLFILGNIISAISSSYDFLMLGRIISALCHGAFFGVGSVVAADSVAPEKKGRAIALMMTGLTLANVLGVPMGTFVGQQFGWRAMFWMVSILGFVGLIGITRLLPFQHNVTKANLKRELSVFKRQGVLLSLLITAMGFGGVFAAFAYIAPMLTVLSGFSSSSMVWLLLLFGVGLVLGNMLGGRAGDKALIPALFILLSALALVLFAFVFTIHIAVLSIITLFLLGVFGFSIVSPVQSQVMNEAADAPILASAANISFFNVGIALGTYFAGYAIHLGFSLASPNWVGGILVSLAIMFQWIKVRLKTEK